MGIKSNLIKPFAKLISSKIDKMSQNALKDQEKIRNQNISFAKTTQFGQDHQFGDIKTYEDFKALVPINDYEGIKNYIEKIKQGQSNVLWPGFPKYFAKTSGTTSGVKYIPLTKESLPNHFESARNALFHYGIKQKNLSWLDGRIIFLSGSPTLENVGGILTGRLSGIVNHQVPNWLKKNQLPSWETNCIDDWEEKLDNIVRETIDKDMRLISGIPPWVQMYYERLLLLSNKSTIKALYPNYSVFVYGGVNFEPYRSKLEELVGNSIDSIETFPASEGFFAFRDDLNHPGLLLNTNSGIFFEFVPLEEYGKKDARRLELKDVQLNQQYALIINNNAGLWGYDIGDTVEFCSLEPYRLKVTGRVKHYISAFGEHVIAKEVEESIKLCSKHFGFNIIEFTVAPQVSPHNGLPYHEWLVEFDNIPSDLEAVSNYLDLEMRKQNIYYEDLISGGILRPLVISCLKPNSFIEYMKEEGKLGGQNKVPRLTNDRKIADRLYKFIIR